jgi:hypothetical protein
MKKLKLLLAGMILTCSIYGANAPEKNDSILFEKLDSLKAMLDSLQVEEPIYVMAQAVYETGWFKCKNCSWKYNNMFGFKGQNGKYLRFKTWQDCVVYYAAWQKKRYPKYKSTHPNGTYLGFLKWCNYATGDSYNKQIQWMYNWLIENWVED